MFIIIITLSQKLMEISQSSVNTVLSQHNDKCLNLNYTFCFAFFWFKYNFTSPLWTANESETSYTMPTCHTKHNTLKKSKKNEQGKDTSKFDVARITLQLSFIYHFFVWFKPVYSSLKNLTIIRRRFTT